MKFKFGIDKVSGAITILGGLSTILSTVFGNKISTMEEEEFAKKIAKMVAEELRDK